VGIAIRPAVSTDALGIAAVHVASWRWAYRGQLPDDVLDGLSIEDREITWREVLGVAANTVLVAERGGSLVGFASGGPSTDDGAASTTAEIYTIYVDEGEAGTGTGTALFVGMREALAADGFTDATLWVLESNARARRFYEREGWAWDGARSDHQVQCAHRPILRYGGGLP
jgi:ribosomal protein S18 acetylase RimI-like enzyme